MCVVLAGLPGSSFTQFRGRLGQLVGVSVVAQRYGCERRAGAAHLAGDAVNGAGPAGFRARRVRGVVRRAVRETRHVCAAVMLPHTCVLVVVVVMVVVMMVHGS